MTPSPASVTANARILIRGTNWIGDAVMTMPAVQRLREWAPAAHIALQCPAKLHDLWRHNPNLNAVLTGEADLRAGKFDLAVIFPNSFRSAWGCWRAGIPRRLGFAGHWRRALLTDMLPDPEPAAYRQVTVAGRRFKTKTFPVVRHQAHRYLDLVAHLGGNRELVPPKIWCGDAAVKKFLPADGRPVCALNAGAEFGPAKRWPADRFAAVARQVDCRWLVLGGPGDVALAGQIAAQLPDVVNVAGRTTLLELCELLRVSRLLLTNDTGPMHLAGALGTPLVAIFGSTSAELTGPLGAPVTILREPVECSPCYLRQCPIDFRCMNRITVEQVAAAVRKLLQETASTHQLSP